jgi:hypothetical protein
VDASASTEYCVSKSVAGHITQNEPKMRELEERFGYQEKAGRDTGHESRARLPKSCRLDRMECLDIGRGEGERDVIFLAGRL